MADRLVLDGIRVAKPCSADWEKMKGDERTRFCSDCGKNVHNISALSTQEAIELVTIGENAPCVRLFRREDGTVLTSDCPVGVARVRRSRLKRLAGLGLVGMALTATGAFNLVNRRSSIPPTPNYATSSADDWIDWALVALGIRKPMIATTGDVAPMSRMGECEAVAGVPAVSPTIPPRLLPLMGRPTMSRPPETIRILDSTSAHESPPPGLA